MNKIEFNLKILDTLKEVEIIEEKNNNFASNSIEGINKYLRYKKRSIFRNEIAIPFIWSTYNYQEKTDSTDSQLNSFEKKIRTQFIITPT